MHPSGSGEVQKRHVIVHDDSHKQERINTVEHASVTRDKTACVFDAGGALDLGFDQVTDLGKDADQKAEDDVVRKADVQEQAENGEEHGAGEEFGDSTFHRFFGADTGEELAPAKAQA